MSLIVRLVLILVGVGAIAGLGAWGYRTIYDAGLTAGRAEVQAKWDADKIATQKLVEQAQMNAAEAVEAAAKNNQEQIDDLQDKLAAAVADANTYAVRLFSAETAAARRSALPSPASLPGAPDAAAPPGPGQLEQAVGARLAECDANEAQLIALQNEVLPQLPKPSQ